MTEQTTLPQSSRIAQKFAELRENVTSADRKAAIAEFKIHTATLSRYLAGETEIKNLDLGVNLLSFLRRRIMDRENMI